MRALLVGLVVVASCAPSDPLAPVRKVAAEQNETNRQRAAELIAADPFWERKLTRAEVLALALECEKATTDEVSVTPDGKIGAGPKVLKVKRPAPGKGHYALLDALEAMSKD